jgi:hypothetical protein
MKLFILLIISILIISCNNQKKEIVLSDKPKEVINYIPKPFKNAQGKMGYLLSKDTLIPPIYDSTEEFIMNIGVIMNKNKYGVVNLEGKLVLKPEFEAVRPNLTPYSKTDNVMIVQKLNKDALISSNGDTLISFGKYDYITEFLHGCAGVSRNKKYGFINTLGQEICPIKYDKGTDEAFVWSIAMIARISGSKKYYGFLDTMGKVLVYPWYEDVGRFGSEGLVKVRYFNRGYGFIDYNGNEAIPFMYDDAFDFNYGYAEVNIGAEKSKYFKDLRVGGRWGMINTKGEIVVPIEYATPTGARNALR